VAVAPLEASAKPGAPAMDGGRAGLHRVPARPQPRDDAFVMSPDARSAWATVLIAEIAVPYGFSSSGTADAGERLALDWVRPYRHATFYKAVSGLR
jgi:hypothetical protein